jgi:hypothetical protein
MIQRLQSILLALAVIFNILLFFMPLSTWVSSSSSTIYELKVIETLQQNKNAVSRITLNMPLILLCSFNILVTLFALLDFKKRIRQARLCHLLILFQLILITLIIYDIEQLNTVAGAEYTWHASAGLFFLAAPVILFLIARKYILKDEALVRSADRLR